MVPKSSLARRGTLTPEQGEKTERLARLYLQAEAKLGGAADPRAFFRAKHPELDNRTPLATVATELGGRAVERILAAVEYGLPPTRMPPPLAWARNANYPGTCV